MPGEVGRAHRGTGHIGTVARLQVQRSPLKPGDPLTRAYDPSPLLRVPVLEIGPRGVRGISAGGAVVLDAHHADHPQSRNRRLANGVSVLPRAHYDQLRRQHGDHLVDGIAGESLLLETDGPLTQDDLAGDLLLETVDDGRLALTGASAMPPCVEFTRFCQGREPGSPVDDELRAALAWLAEGRRGFQLTATGSGRVTEGARLLRA